MSKELLLDPPMVKTKKSFAEKSFHKAAPRLWNTLSSGIRAIRGYDLFNGAIKMYLLEKAFACNT